jgi:hypothetical protein
MTAVTERVRRGDPIRLRIIFENQGTAPVLVPGASRLAAAQLGLRAIDAAWQEIELGTPSPSAGPGHAAAPDVERMQLAPGARHVIEVTIAFVELGSIGQGDMVHLVLDGKRWGSTDTPRVSVQIVQG